MFVSGAGNGETIGFAVGEIVMMVLCLAFYRESYSRSLSMTPTDDTSISRQHSATLATQRIGTDLLENPRQPHLHLRCRIYPGRTPVLLDLELKE